MALLNLMEEFDPASLLTLQRELERSLNNPAFNLGLSGASAYPPVNIFEDVDGLVVMAEVPGLDPAAIQVTAQANTLTIAGERQRMPVPANGGYHRVERPFGRFSRSVQLPDRLDVTRVTAKYEAGVLTVRVPKHEAAKPRQITVAAG